jgi:hypothetical protein
MSIHASASMLFSSFLSVLFCSLLSGCLAPTEDVSLLFVGDTHFGESYDSNNEMLSLLEERGYSDFLNSFSSLLQSADLVIGNLETAVTDIEVSPFEGQKSYTHWTDIDEAPSTFLEQNMTVFSLANNHSMDYGEEGLEQTLAQLNAYGIQTFGAGMDETTANAPYIQTFNIDNHPTTLAIFGGYQYRQSYDYKYDFYAEEESPGVALLSPEFIEEQIKNLENEYDNLYVMAFPHWGDNYEDVSDEQRELAHELIDGGVDMIIGHGAHMLQSIEIYDDHKIVYGIGNFVFNSPGRYQKLDVDPYSAIASLVLSSGEPTLRLYPIYSDNLVTDYHARFLTEDEFTNISLTNENTTGQDEHGHFIEL